VTAALELPSGQVVEAPVMHMRRGHDIEGERFGQLVAVRIVSRSEAGNVWLFACDCGRFAIRAVARVRVSIKRGCVPCCRECHVELLRGYSLDGVERRRARRRALLLARFRETGSLWSDHALDSLTELIRSDCVERLGVAPEERTEACATLPAFSIADAMDSARAAIKAEGRRAAADRDRALDAEIDAELARVREAGRFSIALQIARSGGLPAR
jgi:hypothetical protein